jgi:antitoxin component YwqK of YwqJK toxin-antitoxin module
MQGDVRETGEIEDGMRTGTWASYFSNGRISEEGIYLDGRYLVRNSWGMDGSTEVTEGNGAYKKYYEGTTKLKETGEIRNGTREGEWKIYYRNSSNLWMEVEYVRGKQSGLKRIFSESGALEASGNMVNGLRDGVWNFYHENGQITATATYEDGRMQEKQLLANTPDELSLDSYRDYLR